MASAVLNNVSVIPPPESFLDFCPSAAACSSYGWLSPRISFSLDFADDEQHQIVEEFPSLVEEKKDHAPSGKSTAFLDFEFHLEDPVAMLPADELFSDGKLVPLQLASVRPQEEETAAAAEIPSPEPLQKPESVEVSESPLDTCVFSPKAPRCSSRWKELLGLKKAAQSQKPDQSQKATSTSARTKNPNPRGLRNFLHRNPKSSPTDASLRLPLLRDSNSEPVTISSRHSLSSSSSGPDHEDLPRLSLDNDKPSQNPISLSRNAPKLRMSKHRVVHDPTKPLPDHPPVRTGRSQMRRVPDATVPPRGASVDSPRMNASGKIVFQNLGRSSSSPSSYGGPRPKHRGMERSYSANVRITPVLNVPVCSLRGSSRSVFGFGPLFSQQKKDPVTRSSGGSGSRSSTGKCDKS